ncbi:MAG: adenine phosphoribosyltransferase [Clostridia bacterium]|nr:adenine phosphoribosyltransferase [Clostridia bacterium]
MEYKMTIAGLERKLPLCPINEKLYIGAFIMFGDTELTEACAVELLKKAPDFDVLVTAESKGIPLVCSMARLSGKGKYVLARKSVKLYMKDVVSCVVKSITTAADQVLYLDGSDAEYLKGKKVLIVDDVISTGASLLAIEKLVEMSGGNIVGKMAVLAEGDAIGRDDIIVLADLPLFHPDGTPM